MDELSIVVPEGSIYIWMYQQGLRGIPWERLEQELSAAGKEIRKKDEANYWNGYYKHEFMYEGDLLGPAIKEAREKKFRVHEDLGDYDLHPYLGMPEITNRFVPCNKDNKPMIKWGNGCMSRVDALSYRGQVYLAENLLRTRYVVFDLDIEHGEQRDEDLAIWAQMYLDNGGVCCHTRVNDDGSIASMHVTFLTDRVIPTTHHPNAKVDILGNANNQLRYFKTKEWNGVRPRMLTQEDWSLMLEYFKAKEESEEWKRNGCPPLTL